MRNLGKINNTFNDDKDFDGCSIFGMMNLEGKRFSARDPVKAIAIMHDRGNGLGGGFAAYGIYPEYEDDYAFHIMYLSKEAKERTDRLLTESFEVLHEEEIPTREVNVSKPPLVWRYFVQPFSVDAEVRFESAKQWLGAGFRRQTFSRRRLPARRNLRKPRLSRSG